MKYLKLGWSLINNITHLSKRQQPAVCAIGQNEILIVGGFDGRMLSNAVIVDLEKKEGRVYDNGIDPQCTQSPTIKVGDIVLILAWDPNFHAKAMIFDCAKKENRFHHDFGKQ